MTEFKEDWSAIAEGLLEYETLSGKEIDELLKGNPPERPDLDEDEPGATSAVPIIGKRRKPKDDPDFGGEPSPA